MEKMKLRERGTEYRPGSVSIGSPQHVNQTRLAIVAGPTSGHGQMLITSAPTLDVDWHNVSFATCSIDNMIYVCKVGDYRPVKASVRHRVVSCL
ncbi:putative WD40/YVTN repeat-like-containing domain superfamily [Helianthus annuus]|uniref:WD40/YVTN repeat-like-containing domain superfamily n=1 Tax=Helianthus annuus TaxID=4232 RepID=A0A9K3N521_HELAN|nr:F-box-like/WD repeat-containing protein TBL1XR1 [Helianthus annuus]KAF5787551.1 putative WD40/YVTN repeat-like-containing domain superfamily [Helianthus annuus]